MKYTGPWILTLAILLALSVVPARANLITDPGFESCTTAGDAPPGWTASGDAGCDINPHTGSWDASFINSGTLSQTITTIAGDDYDFSFWLGEDAPAPTYFTASFGSDEVLDLTTPAVSSYTLEELSVTATGTSTTIAFTGSTSAGLWPLDDVSVTDLGAAAPEPDSLILFGTGLVAIAWRFRRGSRAI